MIALHASRSLCRLAVIAIGLIGVTTTANAADPREKLFGMWKLVSGVSEELDTAKKTELWRPDAIGYITFVPEGRMMVLIANSGRGKPAAAVPTTAEAESLFRSLLSYTGTYVLEGDRVTTKVDASWNQTWTGTDQVRTFKLDGDKLSLSTAPSPDPFSGKPSVRTLVWQKLK